MAEEKKTAVTEEVKEEVRKLTEEELEQVSGGVLPVRNKRDVELPDRKPPVYEPPVLELPGPAQSQLRS